jgi:ParB family transcriptional regulator, chromosome partitioning protein
MGKTKLVLGRGLASLIPGSSTAPPDAPVLREDDGHTDAIIAQIQLDRIDRNPFQPRADFDPQALDELKRSILEKGIIQPITVRRIANGYQLISGERRVRAARDAGLARIPAYVISVQTDEEMLELALIENLQREHLNPIEIGISYRRLIEECQLTQEQVAERIGKERSTITNFLRLLKLPEEIQSAVRRGDLSGGHARALVPIEDRKTQIALMHKIIKRGLSVREIEKLVRDRESTGKRHGPRVAIPSGDSSTTSVEDRLRQLLGTRVQIKQVSGGRGEIVIEFYSADDLDRLLEILEGLNSPSH